MTGIDTAYPKSLLCIITSSLTCDVSFLSPLIKARCLIHSHPLFFWKYKKKKKLWWSCRNEQKWGANAMRVITMEFVSHHHRAGFRCLTERGLTAAPIKRTLLGSKTVIKTQLSNTETSSLTSMTSSFFIEREEKGAFAKCPQNPTTRRIFTFQTVSLLLIFQCSQCQSLSRSLCHSCFTDMCKRLFNDSGQCQRGHLGQTVHTPKWEEPVITWARLMSQGSNNSNQNSGEKNF